jgi:hypothetical protein
VQGRRRLLPHGLQLGGDCCDTLDIAYPGSNVVSTWSPNAHCGSVDLNCDGQETMIMDAIWRDGTDCSNPANEDAGGWQTVHPAHCRMSGTYHWCQNGQQLSQVGYPSCH